jgi:hypothetical protein
MSNFYKITKAQATQIGKFEYSPSKWFNPFVGEQVDGTYIISEEMYSLMKETVKFQQIDFNSLPTITKEELQPKQTAFL